MRQKRQMDKLRFLTESRNGKESVIEKLIHKDNSSSNRISCRIAEKSDIKSIMDVCFTRQKWMSERGLGCVVFKETREYYRQKIREYKMMVCVQDDKVLGFCIVSKQDLAEHWPTSLKDGYDGVYVFDCMSLPNTGQEILRLLFDHIMKTFQSDIRLDMEIPNDRLESFYKDRLGFSVVGKSAKEGTTHLLMEKTYTDISESFTRKISRKKNNELTTKSDTAFVPDGVYILHETLGVKTVEGWNPKNNDGVVGVMVVEDEHKIVVALEDSPENLTWSKKRGLINQPVEEIEDAESDFNGEMYCRRLDSPDFPAAYYCKTYNKGNRNWYLPSSGELWLIYNHLEEIQNALSIVGGQKLITTWDKDVPVYWSSTESSAAGAWTLYLSNGNLDWYGKVSSSRMVRPVSKFDFSTLKESFTRKIRSKKNDELTSKPSFELDNGVYILHETLGVCEIDNWDSENNDGVEGILVKDNDTKLIVSVDEFTEIWARKLQSKFNVNKTFIYRDLMNTSDKKKYTGKILCQTLNSPDFPAAYRCLCYHKGNINNWYLPSIQELHTIAEHRHEIQEALIKVNGDILKFLSKDVIILKSRSGQGGNWYWSSTESHREEAWSYNFDRDRDSGWTKKSENSFQVRPVAYFGEESGLEESFTRKISRKNNDELISKADTAFVPDGVYILHETLGVKTVDGWNPKDNDGVVGILLIEDEHRIVIALEDSPKNLIWSEEYNFVNRPIKNSKTAKSEFNGEKYCRNLNSPDFPAAYYCLNYNKGGRDWYLPSMGELWLIRNHLEEIQTASSAVGGQRSVFTWDGFAPCFWSSTERDVWSAWVLNFGFRGIPDFWYDKVGKSFNVLPISKFQPSELKESFTKKIKNSSNKDLVDIADKLASTNYDYNEENFTRKLRKETEQYYKSEFYKVYHFPLDYRYNGDIWPANEDGFHNMYLESTYWAEKNEEVDFEGYYNDVANNCAEPADVGVFVFGYGKDCVAYGEYNEYAKTHQLTESFTSKTKNKTNKDLQDKSDNVFNLDNLLREYVKSHCRPGSHNFDFYFTEENRPVFSDKEWKKLKGITVVKEIDDYYPSLHVVTPNGFTISDDFLPNADDVFLFYVYKRRKFHIPVNRLPDKLSQELKEWVLNVNESFTRKTKQKSAEDIKQKADESVNLENLVKEIVLENDSFVKNAIQTRTFARRQPNCTHVLNNLRVRPTKDPTLSPYAIQGMVVLDESFYFKPEKYDISPLLAETLKKKSMKELYNSDSIIVLNRIYTMEYRGKEHLRTEFNILRYNERYGRYSDEMNPQEVYFEFTDLPKELRLDIYRFLRKKFTEK